MQSLNKETQRSNKKSRFTTEEDHMLVSLIQNFGTRNWNFISSFMKNRNPRQCKERWELFLSPHIDHREWTKEEDDLLIFKRMQLGTQWVLITLSFPRRTEVSVRNRWKYLQKSQQKLNEQKRENYDQKEFMGNKLLNSTTDISKDSFEFDMNEFEFFTENREYFADLK
jgi:hypothetical protein